MIQSFVSLLRMKIYRFQSQRKKENLIMRRKNMERCLSVSACGLSLSLSPRIKPNLFLGFGRPYMIWPLPTSVGSIDHCRPGQCYPATRPLLRASDVVSLIPLKAFPMAPPSILLSLLSSIFLLPWGRRSPILTWPWLAPSFSFRCQLYVTTDLNVS